MKVTNIHLVRRIPREEYGYEEVTINAELTAKEDPREKLVELRQLAADGLEAIISQKPQAEEAPKKAAKKSSKKAKEIDLEEDEDFGGDEDEELEDIEDFDDEEEDEDLDGDEDEEEEKPKTKKSKAAPATKASTKTTGAKTSAPKATKKRKGKVTPFDRELPLHKKLVGEMLDEEKPKWSKKEILVKKARVASKAMDGEDFLDSEGAILESFKSEFLRFFPKGK